MTCRTNKTLTAN